jgi:PAS domain S-box-containing protein
MVVVGIGGYLSWRNAQKTVENLIDQLMTETSEHAISQTEKYLIAAHQIDQVDGELPQLNTVLEQQTTNRSARIFIMERSGVLVAASAGGFAGMKVGDRSQHLRASSSQDLLIQLAAQALEQRFSDFTQIQASQTLEFTDTNQQYVVRVVPFRDGLDWLVVVVAPKSDFIQESSAQTTIALFVPALAGAIALGFLTANWITKPIKRLSQASQDLALGRWDYPIQDVTCITELEILTRCFNQMTEGIEQSFEQVKTALQESEERFTKIFRASPDPIVIVSVQEGRYLEVNDSFLHVTGFTRKQVIGRTVLELSLWGSLEDRDRFRQLLQHQTAVRTLDVNFRTASSEIRTMLLSAEIINIEGQSCMVAIAKDISDRKRIEESLRQSEEKFRQVANHINQVFFVRDASSGQFLYVNPSYERVWGRTCESLYADPKSWLAAIHPDDQAQVFSSLTQQFQGRSVYREYRIIQPNGAVRWIIAQAFPVHDQAGQPIRYVGWAEDITERKQVEEDLRQSEVRFRQLAIASPGIIFTFVQHPDGSHQFEYVSPACREILELEPDRILADAQCCLEQIHPSDRPGYEVAVAHSAQRLTPFSQQFRVIAPSGTIKLLEVNSRPEQRANGSVVWNGIALDVSDRKRAEDALKQAKERIVTATSAEDSRIPSDSELL